MPQDAWTRTIDPDVVIEAQSPGVTVYRRLDDGRRWCVRGVCDRRGDCLIGAYIGGETVRDQAHLAEICARLGTDRPDTEFDVPVTPEFEGCCPFRFEELERARD